MRKVFIVLLFLTLSGFASPVSGEEAGQINAGILPSLWFSDTELVSEEEVRVYGGFYNQSTSTIALEVSLSVDEAVVTTEEFTSTPDSLIEIGGTWSAEGGQHKLQLRIVKTDGDSTLLASESSVTEVFVKPKITTEDVKHVVLKVVETVVDGADALAEDLSQKILDLRKPIVAEELQLPTLTQQTTSTGTLSQIVASGNEEESEEAYDRSAYNLALSFLASSVIHWKITLGAILLLIIVLKLTSRS